MIKLPLILVSYIGLFLTSVFSFEEVQVENNLPAAIAPGQKKLVELTIRKGDIQGFSKLEIPMPVGFNAVPNDIKGASFTFKAQSAKFVWMQLPEEASFTISYYIETASTVKGVYDIGGVFSYVKDNRRLDLKMPSKPVVIKDQATIDAEATPEAPVLASNTNVPQNENVTTETPSIPESLSGVAIPKDIKREAEVVEMTCFRTISKVTDTEFAVKLTIVNNNITGFGKILETLPEHCKTERVNDASAVVTQDKNTIKFVWFEIPTSNTIEVSYKVSCLKPVGEPIINGQLSYTDNGNPIVVPITQAPSTSTPEIIAQNTDSTEEPSDQNSNSSVTSNQPKSDNTNNTTTLDPVIKNADNSSNSASNNETNYDQNNNAITKNSNASTSVTAENKPSKTPVTSVPSAETGVTYKVQILAAHRVVNKTYFQQKFNFTDRFNIENHEGWVKYTTGSFAQYKEARDERERITGNHGKLPGPFVTAYNDGERITVQEALLITNQQWYK